MPGARVAEGERVTLRTVETEDASFLQRAQSNPELRYPLGWDVSRRGDLEDELDDGLDDDEDLFLICVDDDGGPGDPDEADLRRVGCVLAGTSERARSTVGCWVAPEAQGEGYGTEAVSLTLDYLFRTYPHPAVFAKTLPHNDASRALLESLGFTQDGRLRKEAFWDGAYHDSIHYSLLREEWHDGG